jgi:hypothetical protein
MMSNMLRCNCIVRFVLYVSLIVTMTFTKSVAGHETNGGHFKVMLCLDLQCIFDVNMDFFLFLSNLEIVILVQVVLKQ